ncbi:RluA family pseudouridine synthase [Avrilella dinanensis]|uniref:RluA family pseudouridine synthase n=1 Tax=Avrilella dinanensis TaxID=2008672 RepID=UPI0024090C67|nr:RluA family pseudouridine synthase [Avrilella dinanensis]
MVRIGHFKNNFHSVSFLSDKEKLPKKFNFPTNYEPHSIAIQASEEVQKYLQKIHRPDEKGRMYGVLIVENSLGELGFLAAYSGQDKEHDSYFVPPIYDRLNPNEVFVKNEEELTQINQEIEQRLNDDKYLKIIQEKKYFISQSQKEIDEKIQANQTAKKEREKQRKNLSGNNQEELNQLIRQSQTQKSELNRLKKFWKNRISEIEASLKEFEEKINQLKVRRQQLSQQTQQQLFKSYHCLNALGENKDILTIFDEQLSQEPPAGTGDCCAPKLLNYAYQNQLKPITMAEFWWGKSPKTEVRKHLHYYPACRGKCEPLLNHMLRGLEVEENPLDKQMKNGKRIKIIYEDEDIAVIEKPHQLLSVPGIKTQNSVLEQARKMIPGINGAIIVHRLDWATSGLMVLGKSENAYRNLQNQFLKRTVFKRYAALLDGKINVQSGEINLPLRVDLNDRPRQMVCEKLGKKAVTTYEIKEIINEKTRIYLYPVTGRTHQLRVHMAHSSGMNCAIAGDSLYGKPAERLYLQADQLGFHHPITNEWLFFEMKPEF